jgi:hypothetical protein
MHARARARAAAAAIGSEMLVQAFRTIEEQGGATGSMFAEELEIPEHVLAEIIDLHA